MPKPVTSTATYMKNLFQDSLVTGVPQIVQTRNVPRKILKTVILVACIIGFVYQTTEFMKIFYSYPTVMDIDVEYPDIIESPAITFCNLNGLKRLPFCEKYPESCNSPDDKIEFCKAFPNICQEDESNLKFPVGDALGLEETSSPEEIQAMGHKSNETLRHCLSRPVDSFELQPCSRTEELHLSVNDGNTGFKNCYTLFSNVNSSTLNRYKLPVTKAKEPLFHMAFNLEPQQYFRPDRQVGAVIAIHSSNTILNPFFNGFVIKPGNLYTVHLKVVEEKLLPSPYDTRCKDYKEVWLSRGGKGPLNQDVCVYECIFNASMEKCNCVERNLLYPHKEKICDEEEMECEGVNISKCYDACPQPCDFTDFEFDVMERKLEDPAFLALQDDGSLILYSRGQNCGNPVMLFQWESGSDFYSQKRRKSVYWAFEISDFYRKDSITKDHAAVLVFLKRPEKVVYSHRPQYEDIEVFSFLGGYVGMWLGISLVAVFDFLESVVLIVAYWLRRRAINTPVTAAE